MSAKIKPFGEKHAIKSVLFILEYATPLQPQAFADLRVGGKLHETLKGGLPRFTEQQQMMLNIAAGPDQGFFPPPHAMPTSISGVSFDRVMQNGDTELGINIQSQAMFIACGRYVRWDDVWAEVQRYLDILAGWLEGHVQIAGIALQYVDAFTVTFDNGKKGPLVDLFSKTSKYAPANICAISDSFHSHHGFFSLPAFDVPGKLLTNVNINSVDVGLSFDVQIQTLHKFDMTDAIAPSSHGLFNTIITAAYKFLHAENKHVVGDLLTEAVKEQISFNVKKSG